MFDKSSAALWEMELNHQPNNWSQFPGWGKNRIHEIEMAGKYGIICLYNDVCNSSIIPNHGIEMGYW